MENALMQKRDKKFTRLYAFVGLLLICFYLMTELVFELWYRVAANYGLFLIIAFIAISFFLRFFNSSREEKCIVAYAIWVVISRILNGDIYLDKELYFLVRTVLNTGCFICIGFVLDREDRKSFFNLVCAIVCAYWFILATVGLYATLNGTRIALPPADMTVGFGKVGSNMQLTVDNIHRNVSGVWFALAVILMLYQFFSCRRKIWRVPITLAAVVFYFATAMSFCRAAQIALSVAIAMLALLLVLKGLADKPKRLRTLAAIAVILLVLPVSYAGYGVATDVCSAVSSQLSEKADTAEAAQSAEPASQQLRAFHDTSYEVKLNSDNTKPDEKPVFSESRGKSNILILGGRAHLWKAEMKLLAEEPERLIKGGMIGQYMERILEIAKEISGGKYDDQNSQMHNFILDSLLLTGLPGALILIIFTIFVVVRMVRVFFSTDTGVPLQLKLLTLPLAFFLIDNMMEAHIFRYDIIPSILFFFISGVFLAWSYEVLPSGKSKSEI